MNKWIILFCLTACCAACVDSGDRRWKEETGKVLEYCRTLDDTLYYAAARFLIDGAESQFHYQGENMTRYDTVFPFMEALHRDDAWNDEGAISNFYGQLEATYGPLDKRDALVVMDREVLTADMMLSHITQAVDAWREAPWHDSVSFDRFCQYILPYKAGEEPPEDYRTLYRTRYRDIADTTTALFYTTKAVACNLLDSQAVFSSATFWKYPFDLPMSKIEQGRRGACRHLVNHTASVLRSLGIPAAVDYVDTWGNRSSGHLWNVLLMPGDSIYPFEAPTTSYFPSVKFSYKPTKIFRRLYRDTVPDPLPPENQVPIGLLHLNSADVTHQYVPAYDVRIPVRYRYPETRKYRYGVIAVFDNRDWKPAWWGTLQDSVMCFGNMASDVLYMGCYYVKGRLLPATAPFVLHSDGRVEEAGALQGGVQSMHLERKYPIFRRVSGYMGYIKWSQVEASGFSDFRDTTRLFVVDFVPDKYKDTVVLRPHEPQRYVRWHANPKSTGDVAEVEFYGRKDGDGPEIRLTGALYGFPEIIENDLHPYTDAVDGNPETYFAKRKNSEGWVAMDLGEPYTVTRLRFCPRSDTNFILIGDTYELCYWQQDHWVSCGTQTARDQWLDYDGVPSGGLYLLHNLTRGSEERIFTYDEGQQVFW